MAHGMKRQSWSCERPQRDGRKQERRQERREKSRVRTEMMSYLTRF